MAMTAAPDLLTVEEAARVMRIGRTKAHALAREWRTSKGRSGLPVVDIGNVLRVPRQRLEQLLGTALTTCEPLGTSLPSTSPTEAGARPLACVAPNGDSVGDAAGSAETAVPESATTPASMPTRTTSRRRPRHARPTGQLELFALPSRTSAER